MNFINLHRLVACTFLLLLVTLDSFLLAERQKLILVLLDGMRWDFYGLHLPHLQKVAENGVKADWMQGVFVSMSMPSMHSIATGLYPESHGVVHNLYYNSEHKNMTGNYEETLNVTDWFNTGAEPIWVTAKRQGLKVGSIWYPGTHVKINGIKPDESKPITRWHYFNYPKQERIDQTLSWLTDDDYDMVLLYFVDPDAPLHRFGINNENTTYLLHVLDHYIGYLFEEIEKKGLSDQVNVIITSDHGHTEVNLTNYVELYDYINETDIEFAVANYGPTFQLKPVAGKEEKVYHQLKNAHPHMHVFKKKDIPERFHYGRNPRILPIFGYMDLKWEVFTRYDPAYVYRADHGYDNEEEDMRAIFLAQGPRFRKGLKALPFESVDVYELMCDILDIKPAPNNGSRARFEDMLVRPKYVTLAPTTTSAASSLSISLVTLMTLVLLTYFSTVRYC